MASVEVYQGLDPKIGQDVLKFEGYTNPGGRDGKGTFILSKSPPGHLLYLGAWVYLAPESNVSQVGFQVLDAEGENLVAMVPADWKGWKWIEFNTQDATFQPANPKEIKNGKVDFPLQNIDFAWTSSKEGQNFVGVDGLAAVAEPDPSDKPFTVDIMGSDNGEANATFNGQAIVNNFSDKPVDVNVHYSIQTDPLLYNHALPDPLLGADRAMGCKNWIELDGKQIENDNALTNDERDTYFNTDRFAPGGGYEGFQYLDLGQERKITALSYLSGNAGEQHKVDFSASSDGKTYTPIDGLQGVDIHDKWGGPYKLPLSQPLSARFFRLRYHNDGKKLLDAGHAGFVIFVALSKLYVYDGPTPADFEIPQVGALVEEKTAHITAPPHNFALLPLPVETPLKSGSYYFAATIKTPDGPQLFSKDYFARPATEVKIGPDSRFGINADVPGYAQQLKRLGVGWIRFENLKWSLFNDAPRVFKYERDDNIPLDTSIKLYHEAGLSILPFIQRTPSWAATPPPNERRPPKDYDDFGKAIFETVARYGSTPHSESDLHTDDKKNGLGWITTWELWDDPNTSPDWGNWAASMEKYFDLFRVGAEAAKRADPNARVAMAGLYCVPNIPMGVMDSFRTYKYPDGKSALDFADILNVHRYTAREEPEWAAVDPKTNPHGIHSDEVVTFEKELIDLADWRDQFKPSVPIWVTEIGCDVDGPMGRTERIQAAKIPRSLMLCLANGVEKVFLYRDVGSIVTWHNHLGTGLIREDNSIRPSYFAMATLIRQLDGVTDLRTLRLQTSNPKVWMYNWKRGDDHVLTAWVPEGTEPLGFDLGKCHVTDTFGRESDVEVTKDFPLSIFPVYITQITKTEPVTNLEKEAAAREAQRKKTWAFLFDKAHLYLYDFGFHQNATTKTFAIPKAIVPVEIADAYDAKNGYGFLSKDGTNNWSPWDTNDPMEKGSVVFHDPDGFQFQIDAAPGTYDLELKVLDAADDAKLTISGAQNGDLTVPLVNAGLTKAKVIVSKQSLVFKVPSNIRVKWLTLVESPPQTP